MLNFLLRNAPFPRITSPLTSWHGAGPFARIGRQNREGRRVLPTGDPGQACGTPITKDEKEGVGNECINSGQRG